MNAALNYQHIDHVSDWASRLGFREIANGLKTIFLESDMELSDSESVSNDREDM
jgi:hypothetical protein